MRLTALVGLTHGRWPSIRRKASLVALTAVAALAGAASASADTVIDTTGFWNGSDLTCGFGRSTAPVATFGVFTFPATNFGQLVTVPPRDTALDRFTVFMSGDFGRPATLVLRGEVYGWDGQKAVGPALWEGPRRSVTLTGTPTAVTFQPNGVPLVAGARYVLFASVSRDFGKNTDPALGCWGFILPPDPAPRSVYEGGSFVFQDAGGDPSLWTTAPWLTIFFGPDLAFKAAFRAARS